MNDDTKMLLFSIAGLVLMCILYRCMAVSTQKSCTESGGQYVSGTQGFACIHPKGDDK